MGRESVRVLKRYRAAWAYAGVIAVIALFVSLSEDVREEEFLSTDQRTLVAVRAVQSDAMTAVMRGLTFLGGFFGAGLLTVAMAAVLSALRRRRDAVFVLALMAGGGVIQYLAKVVFARPRPTVVEALVDVSTTSYPSGHAMISACLALAFAIVCWNTAWRWPATIVGVFFTLGVSFSRLYLGVHYPSDILAGWLLAITWTSVVWLVFDLAGRRVPTAGV